MNAQRAPLAPPAAPVVALHARRIERALRERSRYKYVHPRVQAHDGGWKVVSPNCSRNVARDGAEIDIAWLQPAGHGRWHLHARDHGRGCWVCKTEALPLAEALARLCADPLREYWL